MGLDGFSLGNLGLNLNKTSSAMASDASVLALQGTDDQIKSMDGVTKKQKAQKKDKDSSFNKLSYDPDFFDYENAEEGEDAPQSTALPHKIDIVNEDFSKYRFRMNSEQFIEVFDSETKTILRTISPEDAARVLMNISNSPSVIVNEEI